MKGTGGRKTKWKGGKPGIRRLGRKCVSLRTCSVGLYERRVAKPLSICNPDRNAFVPRFTGEVPGKRRRFERERGRGREVRGKKRDMV